MDYSDLIQTVEKVGAPDRTHRTSDAEHDKNKKEREKEIEAKKQELEKARLQAKIEKEKKKVEREKARRKQATSVSKDYRGDMKDSVEEALTIAQRLKRGRVMKQKAKIIQRKREISLKKRATPEKLKKRAMKKARDILKKKYSAGKDMKDVGFAQREKLEKMLDKKKAVILKIAKKLLPIVRKGENERIKQMRGGNKE